MEDYGYKPEVYLSGEECSTQMYVCVDQERAVTHRTDVLHADAVQRHNKPNGDQLA